MRHIVLSRPYLAVWLIGYLFLWSGTLIEYPAWLFQVNIAVVGICSLMAIPWVLLIISGFAAILSHLMRSTKKRKTRTRYRPRRSQRPSASPHAELPDLSIGGGLIQEDSIGHPRARITGYILRSYIMQPHVHTSRLKYCHATGLEDAYIQVREHLSGEKNAQYYQDLCLASLSAYYIEQKLGYIPGESSRLMITQAQQACRQLAISLGEYRNDVVSECYETLNAQAEELTDALLESLKSLATTLRDPMGTNPFVLHEAEIVRWHQRISAHCDQQLQEKLAA